MDLELEKPRQLWTTEDSGPLWSVALSTTAAAARRAAIPACNRDRRRWPPMGAAEGSAQRPTALLGSHPTLCLCVALHSSLCLSRPILAAASLCSAPRAVVLFCRNGCASIGIRHGFVFGPFIQLTMILHTTQRSASNSASPVGSFIATLPNGYLLCYSRPAPRSP